MKHLSSKEMEKEQRTAANEMEDRHDTCDGLRIRMFMYEEYEKNKFGA